VVVTHNAGLAAAMDRTLRLSGGRVHEDGAARAARRGGRGGTA
jgi:ABC-type lipoprotein export system ATPase subunit